MRRSVGLFVAAALIALAALTVPRCMGSSDTPGTVTGDRGQANAPVAESAVAPNGVDAATSAARDRSNALHHAVSTLHRYLTALGTGERATSDPYWAGGKPPRESREADLRALKGVRSLRIENSTPQALDTTPVPTSVEIPVTLRVRTATDSALVRYQGWYRLRRKLGGQGWEITSASIDRTPPAQ